MRWQGGSFFNGDYSSEQHLRQEVAAADDVADDKAEADDEQGHSQPSKEFQYRIVIRGEELPDRGKVDVDEEQMEYVDV